MHQRPKVTKADLAVGGVVLFAFYKFVSSGGDRFYGLVGLGLAAYMFGDACRRDGIRNPVDAFAMVTGYFIALMCGIFALGVVGGAP